MIVFRMIYYLRKLKAYGIDKKSINLLRSYLIGRRQRVKLNSEYSSFVDIDRGIPQGSILGPLLFNIFLNDLLLDFKLTEICYFADDNSLYKGDKNLELLKKLLTEGIKEVLEWFKYNSNGCKPGKVSSLIIKTKKQKYREF